MVSHPLISTIPKTENWTSQTPFQLGPLFGRITFQLKFEREHKHNVELPQGYFGSQTQFVWFVLSDPSRREWLQRRRCSKEMFPKKTFILALFLGMKLFYFLWNLKGSVSSVGEVCSHSPESDLLKSKACLIIKRVSNCSFRFSYRGRPQHLLEDMPDSASVSESFPPVAGDDEPSVIVQLSNRVQDGTRCRPGSLDMCIQGKCQVSGCWRNEKIVYLRVVFWCLTFCIDQSKLYLLYRGFGKNHWR